MSVYKNNRDKWCIDIDFVHPDGRVERVRKTSPDPTKTGATAYERKTRASLLDGTYGKSAPTEAPTVAEFKDSYMDVYRGEKRKASGIRDKECLFEAHVLPLFGTKKVDGFRLIDQHKLRARFANHKSNSRHNGAVALLNRLIELYYKLNEIKTEPFRFELLQVIDKTRKFYDFEQYRMLRDGAGRHSLTGLLACLLGGDAGLRRGEMFALTASHCDMRGRMLVIEEAEVVIKSERHMGQTKGLKTRYVDMTDRLHAALARYLAENRRATRILVDANGEPFTPESFRDHLMAPIQELAGLPANGNVHILRHTFCSHLAIRGVPVLTIQKLAGHSRIETTLKYMHLAPGETRRAIDLLEAVPAEQRQPGGNGLAHSHELA